MTPPMTDKTALEERIAAIIEENSPMFCGMNCEREAGKEDEHDAAMQSAREIIAALAPPVVVGEDDGARALVNRLYDAADDLAVMPQAGDAQKARTMREAAALIAVLDTGSTNLGNRLTALSAELAGWKASFVGHVYVTNEEYSLLCAAAKEPRLLLEIKKDQVAAHQRALAAEAALEVTRAALEPFKDAFLNNIDGDGTVVTLGDWEAIRNSVDIGHFRRASEAVAKIEEKK